VVTDPREVPIFEALEDPEWEWRTLGALSRISGSSLDEVRGILAKYPQFVRKSITPSKKGEELYTLQQRYFEAKNPVEKIWTILSSSSGTTSGS
jgi:hypothetical protein